MLKRRKFSSIRNRICMEIDRMPAGYAIDSKHLAHKMNCTTWTALGYLKAAAAAGKLAQGHRAGGMGNPYVFTRLPLSGMGMNGPEPGEVPYPGKDRFDFPPMDCSPPPPQPVVDRPVAMIPSKVDVNIHVFFHLA